MAIAVARGGPPTGRFTGRLDPKCLDPRLFREAAQLTTVGTAVSVAGTEAGHVEIQVHAKGAANCRCPTVSALADAHWSPQSSTESCVAEARGDAARQANWPCTHGRLCPKQYVSVYSERQRNGKPRPWACPFWDDRNCVSKFKQCTRMSSTIGTCVQQCPLFPTNFSAPEVSKR